MRSRSYVAAAALLLIVLQVSGAELPRMKMEVKWLYSTRAYVGGTALLDANGDGKREIFVGLENNTVLVLDRFGKRVDEFVLGNASQIGRIYSMDIADVDEDGAEELIFGLGGAREVRTYVPHDFEMSDTAVTPKDKVLYRVIRNHGGVYVVNPDGTPVWRYLTEDSVKAVAWLQKPEGGGFIAAGVGDLLIYTYNERTEDKYKEEQCTSEYIVDEESGWATEEDCLDTEKCCYGLRDCSCWWDDSPLDQYNPDGQTVDICYRSYTKIVCEEDVEGDVVGWRYVDYTELNGTVVLINQTGGVVNRQKVELVDDVGKVVEGVDNTVRDIFAGDLDGDKTPELLVASNNGEFVVLNMSNTSDIKVGWKGREAFRMKEGTQEIDWEHGDAIRRIYAGDIDGNGMLEVCAGSNTGFIGTYDSAGKLIWKQRVDDAVTDIEIKDVELDGSNDIVISARDGNVYVYDAVGYLKWGYFIGDSLYGLDITDIDGNGLSDLIGYTMKNVTRYEVTEYYIKKSRADYYYNKAYDSFMEADYTSASIYIDKAYELYKEIDDRDSLPRCELLRSKIDVEFMEANKREADGHYTQALNYYAMNDFEAALRKLEDARRMYVKLGDEDGVENCNLLKANIEDETRAQRRLVADGYYTKAVTLSNFGNYSGALELIERAKAIYQEVSYYNGTVQCDRLIIGIADRNYRNAVNAFESNDFVNAMSYAETARDLYSKAGYHNMSVTAAELAGKANESIGKPITRRGEVKDYTPYALGVVLLVFLATVYTRVKRPKAPRKELPPKEEIDEELEVLEKEGA